MVVVVEDFGFGGDVGFGEVGVENGVVVGFWWVVFEGVELVWLEGGGCFVEMVFGILSDEDGFVGRGEGEDFWWWEFGCWFCYGG